MADSIGETPRPQISVGAITEADIKEAMMGNPLTPTYQEQFGLTAAELGTTGYQAPTQAELEHQAAVAFELAKAEAIQARQANTKPDPFSTPEEVAHWQKLYGDSENEKGALRKSNQEMLEAFNGLMAQFEALQSVNPQAQQQSWQPGPPMPMPQQGNAYPGFTPPQYLPDPFDGISDDDVMQGRQFKQFTQRVIEPAFQALLQQNQAALQRTAFLEGQMLKQAKLNAGITPMEELRLMGKYPWLKGLPEANRLAALAGMKAQETAQAPQPAPTPAYVAPPLPAPTETQNRILNKVTYIEGAQPQVQDTSEAAIEAAKMRDFAKVMAAPQESGERAKLFRVFAQKYGMSGLGGNPSDISH